MANAKRDGNFKPTLIAADSSTGAAVVLLKSGDNQHALKVSNGTTGTDYGDGIIQDQNRIPVLFAVSSADGATLIPIYADPDTGALLVKST